jgi:hypothetical protein
VFYFKFREINNEADIKIKKINKIENQESFKTCIKNLGLLNHFIQNDENKQIVLFDISQNKSELPTFFKQAIFNLGFHENELVVALIKDPINADNNINFDNSLKINLQATKKDHVDIISEIKKQEPVVVDLKNMLNPHR